MLLALHAPIPDPVARQATPPHSLLVKMNLYSKYRTLFFFKIFFMWSSFKVFIEFVIILFLFNVLAFWLQGM